MKKVYVTQTDDDEFEAFSTFIKARNNAAARVYEPDDDELRAAKNVAQFNHASSRLGADIYIREIKVQ